MKRLYALTLRKTALITGVILALLGFCPGTLAAEKGFVETLIEIVAPDSTQPEKPTTQPKKDK